MAVVVASESPASEAFEAQEEPSPFSVGLNLRQTKAGQTSVPSSPDAVKLRTLSATSTAAMAGPLLVLDESVWPEEDEDEEEGFEGWAVWTPASFCAPEEFFVEEQVTEDASASSSTSANGDAF